MRHRSRSRTSRTAGFTLVELLVVVVIMSLMGAMVIPMMVDMGAVEAQSVARVISTDLQYAQNVAITHQQAVTVEFFPDLDRYELRNQSGRLIHPMTNAEYVVDLRADHDFERFDLLAAGFDGGRTVTFDELGSPDAGGSITVEGGGLVWTVQVAPVTGTVTVSEP